MHANAVFFRKTTGQVNGKVEKKESNESNIAHACGEVAKRDGRSEREVGVYGHLPGCHCYGLLQIHQSW